MAEMNGVAEGDLNPWRNADDLLETLYRVGQADPPIRDSIVRLLEHEDSDVREEALRILLTRWKDRSLRERAILMLRFDPDVPVRSAAAFGVASVSTEHTLVEDTQLLRQILTDDDQPTDVRAAAYDALLIMYRKPAFPTKKRDFRPEFDVDWQWINGLEDRR